ncbi:MAG: GreA/GreB family elongation factor [Trueperaceae bacterium]|nr:GreA/GreB family elongation factor [Trueperaceae bacterium]
MPPETGWLAASCALESPLKVATTAPIAMASTTAGPVTPAATVIETKTPVPTMLPSPIAAAAGDGAGCRTRRPATLGYPGAKGVAMSRAFVKEDADAEPVVVPARAALPDGVPNLVTPAGLAALERERGELVAELERARAAGDVRAAALAAGRLDALRARIGSARVVELPDPPTTVDVGARVTLRRADGRTLSFRVVGVDEADPATGSVAFTAPVAAAAVGQPAGGSFVVRLGDVDVVLEVVDLSS